MGWKQYGVQLLRHGHGGVDIHNRRTRLRASHQDGTPFTSPSTLRDRRVLALASMYRSVHHQLLHLRACCTSTSLACEIAVIRHPPGTNCHTNRHTLQGRRRACHTAALSFPPFSCKSSARSISSSLSPGACPLYPGHPAHDGTLHRPPPHASCLPK